jgi:hypothetical protein
LVAVPEAAPQATVPARGVRKGSFRALHSRPFRLYFAGQVISSSGTFLQQTAIGWLVLKLTGSASSLGLVLAVGGLPSLILGPWGGAIAEAVVPTGQFRPSPDGTLVLLGRGSSCINTAGEKVYPEEVEEVIKALAWVEDALFGIDDERFGQKVAAVITLAPDADGALDAILDAARVKLASFKLPAPPSSSTWCPAPRSARPTTRRRGSCSRPSLSAPAPRSRAHPNGPRRPPR